jgi:hypothetical protein
MHDEMIPRSSVEHMSREVALWMGVPPLSENRIFHSQRAWTWVGMEIEE